jgi:GNAT superfamily N-acetyltransferase
MSTQAFSIRRTVESDWREIRQLRLEMIRDTPTAYIETLEQALSHDEPEWRMRGQRGTSDHGIAIAAISDSGRWIGTMGAFVPDPDTGPLLVGVYVASDFRGSLHGLTDALLATIEEWARTESSRLTLHVHEDNTRARKAYERRGFTSTGQTVAYILDPRKTELEMVKQLSRYYSRPAGRMS